MFTVPWWAFQVSCRCGSYKQPRQQHHQLRHNQPTKTHSPTVFLHQHIINLPIEICTALFLVEAPTAHNRMYFPAFLSVRGGLDADTTPWGFRIRAAVLDALSMLSDVFVEGCCNAVDCGVEVGGVEMLCSGVVRFPLGSREPSMSRPFEVGSVGGIGLWYGMVWYGMIWCGMVWYGVVWCGAVWCGMV